MLGHIKKSVLFLVAANIIFAVSSTAAGQNQTKGTWEPISLNTMLDVNPCSGGIKGCAYSANGFDNIINGWNGGTFAENLGPSGSLLVWGGGHRAYWGNEIYRFDISQRTWSRATDPSVLPNGWTWADGGGSNVEWPGPNGAAPGTYHTYHGLQYDPVTKSFITFRDQVGASHMFDFNSGRWSRGPKTGLFSFNMSSAYDKVRKVFYVFQTSDSRRFISYDVAKRRVDVMSAPVSGIDQAMAVNPDKSVLVILDWRSNGSIQMIAKDLVNDSNHVITNVANDVPQKFGQGGFVWVDSRKKFAWWSARTPNDLYWLTLPDGDWTTGRWSWQHERMSGASFTIDSDYNGTYGRFRFAPALDSFVVVTNVGDSVYAYRPRLDAVDTSGIPPAITMPMSPSQLIAQ